MSHFFQISFENHSKSYFVWILWLTIGFGKFKLKFLKWQKMREKYGIWKIFSFFVKIPSLRQMWENRIIKGHRMVRAERPEDKQKARRTNIMLFTISMVFCVAWLPLNLIGILLDAEADLFGDNIQAMILTFIACHLVSMNAWWVCARAIYISAKAPCPCSSDVWLKKDERWGEM